MSFVYPSGAQYAPLPYQYHDQPKHRSLQWWHVALLLISVVMAMVGVFARLVLGNLQPINSEVLPNISINTIAPIPAAPATLPVQVPETAPLSDESRQLQAEIDAWIKARTGTTWAVDVHQINGDLKATSSAEKTYSIASLYKLFLLQPLAKKVPSSNWEGMVGDRSYKSCVDVMLRLSDNPCAEAIGSSLGWSYVDKQLRSLGYGDTHLSVGEATGTARDTGLVLRNLYERNGFDAQVRTWGLESLVAVKKVEGIRKACTGCTVYNKVGYINDYKHDAAIVEKNGRAYSVVIMSKGGSWKQISDLTAIIQKYL